ncbi:hypothetical protein SAT01_06950 [Sinomonas atrocyanea]|uniref:SIR2 family NAD-dependent protein deacylase n=1 Tax=Sinomonas atrocyanea TaxID=37927 RepID=UPI00082A2363|nr:hypothetical protein SAT01_06950 [Sinomonas atrocyanea]GGG69674.1 hypothetical protein GCM10007172_22300 [Sinomonas atrocyanea]
MPSAWGVLQDLLSQLAGAKGAEPEGDDGRLSWYQDEYGEDPTYERVLERLAPAPRDRQALLRGYFEATPEEAEQGKKQPTAAHRAIARLVAAGFIRVIVTLNFDNLMEAALREQSVTPVVIRGQNDLKGLPPMHTARVLVVHLHGDYLAPEEMRNTELELGHYEPAAERFLDRIMEEYGLLFVGWSARYDPQLRAAVKRSFRRIYVPYWVEPAAFADEASELVEQLGAVKVESSADDALGKLHDACIALRDRAAARHPLTPAVVASTVRSELSGRYTAFHLHDLVKQEADRLHRQDDLVLSYTGTVSENGAYAGMVGRIEEASNVLVAAMSAAAYWGNETTDRWILSEIRNFAEAPKSGGVTVVLDLHNVVMMRLFYATGVGALAAGRYGTVSALFSLEGDRRGTRRDYAVQVLEPVRLCEGNLPSASKRLYEQLRPMFVQHLSIGSRTYDESWAVFEILRNLAAAAAAPEAQTYLPELGAARVAFDETRDEYDHWAKQQSNSTAPNGREAFERYAPVRAAEEKYKRALDLYAQLIPMALPHLRVELQHSEGVAYKSPTVQRLIREVSSYGSKHPLLESGLLPGSPLEAVQTLRAANVALERVANWTRQNRMGILPDEFWADE